MGLRSPCPLRYCDLRILSVLHFWAFRYSGRLAWFDSRRSALLTRCRSFHLLTIGPAISRCLRRLVSSLSGLSRPPPWPFWKRSCGNAIGLRFLREWGCGLFPLPFVQRPLPGRRPSCIGQIGLRLAPFIIGGSRGTAPVHTRSFLRFPLLKNLVPRPALDRASQYSRGLYVELVNHSPHRPFFRSPSSRSPPSTYPPQVP